MFLVDFSCAGKQPNSFYINEKLKNGTSKLPCSSWLQFTCQIFRQAHVCTGFFFSYFLSFTFRSYLADLVHLLLPVLDEQHTLLQAAQILQATLTRMLLKETQTQVKFKHLFRLWIEVQEIYEFEINQEYVVYLWGSGEAVGFGSSAGGRAVGLDALLRQVPAYGTDGAALGGAAVLHLQQHAHPCRGAGFKKK